MMSVSSFSTARTERGLCSLVFWRLENGGTFGGNPPVPVGATENHGDTKPQIEGHVDLWRIPLNWLCNPARAKAVKHSPQWGERRLSGGARKREAGMLRRRRSMRIPLCSTNHPRGPLGVNLRTHPCSLSNSMPTMKGASSMMTSFSLQSQIPPRGCVLTSPWVQVAK